ncbi:unnamed protein product, partial [Echinostoma caproni]|uniref:Vegetative cell wall protein gp1-like n=1 Tax=Echinostoma caproni TaxID=27848 RepID=A0A183BC25_9TREM
MAVLFIQIKTFTNPILSTSTLFAIVHRLSPCRYEDGCRECQCQDQRVRCKTPHCVHFLPLRKNPAEYCGEIFKRNQRRLEDTKEPINLDKFDHDYPETDSQMPDSKIVPPMDLPIGPHGLRTGPIEHAPIGKPDIGPRSLEPTATLPKLPNEPHEPGAPRPHPPPPPGPPGPPPMPEPMEHAPRNIPMGPGPEATSKEKNENLMKKLWSKFSLNEDTKKSVKKTKKKTENQKSVPKTMTGQNVAQLPHLNEVHHPSNMHPMNHGPHDPFGGHGPHMAPHPPHPPMPQPSAGHPIGEPFEMNELGPMGMTGIPGALGDPFSPHIDRPDWTRSFPDGPSMPGEPMPIPWDAPPPPAL